MLSDAQHRAVTTSGPRLITACPGSGKTFVIEESIAHLYNRNPQIHVCAVTFTKSSAAELEERVRKRVPHAGNSLTCGTFHSICKRMLEWSGKAFKLIDEGEQLDLLRRAHVQALRDGYACEFEDAIQYIDRMKNAPDPILPPPEIEPRAAVYHAYQALLIKLGLMDFTDLIVQTVRGLQDGSVPPLKVHEMLIDEFQDSDAMQLSWAIEHFRKGVCVSVVGDDDQSIYSFRGGQGYSGLIEFQQATNATLIELNLTYRCPMGIMGPAAALITKNTERVSKELGSAARGVGSIYVREFPHFEAEVDEIVRTIARSGDLGSWAVLARTNFLLDAVERALTSSDATLSYERLSGESFWNNAGPAAFLGVCGSLAHGNLLGADRLLSGVGVPDADILKIHERVQSRSGPGSLHRFLAMDWSKAGASARKIMRVQGKLRDWLASLGNKEDELVLVNLREFMFEHGMECERGASPERRKREQNLVRQCERALARTYATSEGLVVKKKGNADLAGRLMNMKRDRKPKEDSIKLATLHASKGLQFPRVWILGCQKGLIPSPKSSVEEERRLFYVGITRAQSDLFLSYSLDEKRPRSPFLEEAGLR